MLCNSSFNVRHETRSKQACAKDTPGHSEGCLRTSAVIGKYLVESQCHVLYESNFLKIQTATVAISTWLSDLARYCCLGQAVE